MSRVIRAFTQFFDDAGDPLENGWLSFLYSGTNNSAKPTFADAEHNIPNANPVQLDAAGRVPNVFGVGIYRVVLYANDPITNLPGLQIQMFDPVQAEGSVTGSGDDFEEWQSTVTYEIGNIVKVGEDYYRSYTTANFNNYPPSNADKWENIDFIRYWNNNVSYMTDDIAVLDGVIYTSLQDSNINNDPPFSPTYWSAIGGGTTLLNWIEDGTVFRPVIAGYDLGAVGNAVGDFHQVGALYHLTAYEIYIDAVLACTVDASQIFHFENVPRVLNPVPAISLDEELTPKSYVDYEVGLVDAKFAIQNVTFANLASPPGTTIQNDLWYVNDYRYLKMYNGAAWVNVKSEIFFNLAASPPTGALNDIWFVSDTGQLKFHNGATWLATTGETTRYRQETTATAGQTVFTTTFSISNEFVFVNGVLLDSSEYVIGTNQITLDSGAALNDIISILSYHVPPLVTATDFVLRAGDTMTGDLSLGGNDLRGVASMNDGALAGYRNLIINGNFNVWQRGISFTSMATNTYMADRFRYAKNGSMVHNGYQNSDVPDDRSKYSLRIDCSTAQASLGINDYTFINYTVEGYDALAIRNRVATLSFWVKSTISGIMCIRLNNDGPDYYYIMEVTINTPNTWEKKEVQFTIDDSTGTWDFTTAKGLQIGFILACGTNYQSTAGTWQVGNYLATSNQTNFCADAANDIYFSQIQLEVGEQATIFEAKPFSDELKLCQRYYECSATSTPSDLTFIHCSQAVNTKNYRNTGHFSVIKRGVPTVTVTTGAADGSGFNTTAPAVLGQTQDAIRVYKTAIGTADGAFYMWGFTADAEI